MAGTNIKRDLPNDEYNAAINANSPSAANPFATIADAGSNIYTSDGTIAVNRLVQIQNGLIWSGSTMLRTTNTRNIKEVIQESDLGSTLAANTTYVIRGKVTVSNSIAVTNVGTEIVGLNRDVDEIEWAGTGNLFFVRDTNFTLANLKLSSSTAGNNIISALNVQGTGYNNERNKIITITNCQFRGTYDIMDIDGFDLVDINQCLFFYVKATNWGLRFRDTSKLQITSSELIRWFDETSLPNPVPADFSTVSMIEFRANGVGPGFGAVNINGCIIHPQETQNGIDIAAGSTTGFGTISSNAFVDTGLTTGKVFLPEVPVVLLPDYSQPETIKYDVFANQGILNSTSGCVGTLSGNTTPTNTAAGIQDVNTNGSAATQAAVRFTVGTNGVARYDGTNQRLFFYVKATNWGLRFRDTSKLQITSSELIRWFDETSLPNPVPADFSTVSMIEFRANGVGPGFGAVNINGCIIHPQETQNGIDIAAGSTTGFGTISSNAFVDTGLTTGKVFLPEVPVVLLPDYSQPETIGYDVFANQGILNSVSGTVMTLTGNTNDTSLSSGVPVIINTNGGVVQQAGVRYTVTGAGRATYIGKKQVYVSIHASISYEKQGGGVDDYKFYIYKNGALLPGAEVDILVDDDASTALPMVYGTLMSQNDYIEFYVENPTGNDAMLVKDFQVVIRD